MRFNKMSIQNAIIYSALNIHRNIAVENVDNFIYLCIQHLYSALFTNICALMRFRKMSIQNAIIYSAPNIHRNIAVKKCD